MKEFEMHGRMEEPARERRRREKRDMDGKKEEEEKVKVSEPKGFLELFNGKEVKIQLITKESLEGKLESNPYNKFDLLLHTSKGVILLPKHAVAYITEKEEK